jgi:branched-chain amino acid transport system substrate-binding protein
VLVLCTLTVAAACGQRQGEYILGCAGPWDEGFGRANRRGIELAVDEVNAGGGIDGIQLQVDCRNDEGDGARAAAIADSFANDPAVVAVVGHVNSGAMLAAAKVYDGRLPAVATTASSPALTGISPWVFRVISSDSANGADLARAMDARGLARAAILYENDGYGRGLADAFRASYRGTVLSIDPIPADFDDPEPFVAYFQRLQPQVVLVAGTERSGIAFLREAKRQRLAAEFVGGDGWTGVVGDTAAAEGALVGAPFTPADPRPEAQRFVNAFRARFGADPDGNSALAYDATMVLAEALRRVGPDRRRIRDWLAGLDEARAWTGATGPIRFRPDGDPIGKSIVLTRIRGGRLVMDGAR